MASGTKRRIVHIVIDLSKAMLVGLELLLVGSHARAEVHKYLRELGILSSFTTHRFLQSLPRHGWI